MMEIGVIQTLTTDKNPFEPVRDFGLKTCQLNCWDPTLATRESAERVKKESAETGVRVCAMWAGYTGPAEWNFIKGPVTLGIVPEEFRAMRVAQLKQWADFAAMIGAPAIITHCGFIPENMTDPAYDGVVEAIADVAKHCKSLGIGFWFETGQETPVVILRTIERVGTGNLGINLDPANLIMYGKGNPIDALDTFGQYVRNVHAKDGVPPTDGMNLGHEVAAGLGNVRYPEFISKLKKIGFTGELVIEREISGEEQAKDIRATVVNLNKWIAEG